MAVQGETDLIQFEGGVLVCDMLLDAQAQHQLELTQYAIESGAVISDHAVHRPFTVDLTLVQTQTPITPIAGFSVTSVPIDVPGRTPGRQTTELQVRQSPTPANFNGLVNTVTSRLLGALNGSLRVEGIKADTSLQTRTLRVTALTAGSPKDRVNDFYDQLLGLLEGVTPLIVTVKGYTWIDMVLTSVTRNDAPSKFGAATFQVSLQRVTTVTTQTVELPPVPQATKSVGRGAKPVKVDTGPPAPAVRQSYALTAGLTGKSLVDSALATGEP